MHVLNLESQVPFTTKDGSTIRSILDRTNAPVRNQSLAEATVPAGVATQRHYHRESEEFYFILSGSGKMALDGEERTVAPGDAIVIPPGAWHSIAAATALRFLCCCAPPYTPKARRQAGLRRKPWECGSLLPLSGSQPAGGRKEGTYPKSQKHP